MAVCHISGHADMYGLGIRISFYLQWFGMIITCWLVESDALNLKFLNGLTILATSIGLALKLQVLQPVEIYVVLLLLCGTLYFLIPIYLWRVLTCCRPWWDPERWNRIKMGWLFRTAIALISCTVLGLQIWFWCTGVYQRPPGTDEICQQIGFLFGQMPLNGPAITAINVMIHIAMLTVGTWLFCDWIGMCDECRWRRKRRRRRWRITPSGIQCLQQFRTISDFLVAAIVTMAIELVISWNNISGVNNLDSAAQLIPLFITGAYLLRSIYVWMADPPQENSHYVDFPYFPTGDGGIASYTVTSDSGADAPTWRPTVYEGYSQDWAGQRRHSHRHRRHRRNTHADYDAGEPKMSTAYSRHATVVDAPDEGHAAENIVPPDPVHENA